MGTRSAPDTPPRRSLPATQVGTLAAIALAAGLAIGYQFPGSQLLASPAHPLAKAVTPTGVAGKMGSPHRITLEDMKQMADVQAAPLLEKLKSDPNNVTLLVQIGATYHMAHQFREAAEWYGRAVQMDPRNVANRTRLASSLYREGDVDGAIAQLNQSLSYEPKDADSLFNLGLIRLQGKNDGKGALAAWQQLLKTNPQLSPERKATVQQLMAGVLTSMGDQQGREGAGSHDRHKSNSD